LVVFSPTATNVMVIEPTLAGFFRKAALGWSSGRSATRRARETLAFH
jgi:hypothetical protein